MGAASQERTEQATPHKLRKSRAEGQVAVSRDLTSVAVLGAAYATVLACGAGAGERLADVMRCCLQFVRTPEPDTTLLLNTAAFAFAQAALACAPLLLVAALAAGVSRLVQIGPLLALKALQPKLERLNPVEGLKNKLFRLRNVFELLKSLIKAIVAVLLCWQVVRAHLRELLLLPNQPARDAALLAGEVFCACVARVLLAFLALALLDLLYQRWQYVRDQRMSKEEVKREHKDDEGDPHLNAQRRQLHREIAMQDMLGNLRRRADVVVRNPTHIACALAYDPREQAAPCVVAKGTEWLAREIVRIAEQEGIPIVRDVPLARALKLQDLEQPIPRELYEAVSQVLRWAEEIGERQGRKARWRESETAVAEISATNPVSPR